MKLTLSYAGLMVVSGAFLLAAVGLFLFWYVPDGQTLRLLDLLRAFASVITAALFLLIVLGLGGGWILTGRTLAPLARIGNVAQLVAQGSLSHRVALSGPRDDFSDVADVFDSMLGRLEAHVVERQCFAANASHELRTPLAISKTLLEVARTDPERGVDALIDQLHEVNTRAIDLTEALLLLGQAERRSFTRDIVDLSLIAEEAIENLISDAERRQVSMEVDGDTARVLGSPALLQHLATNLVHNAIVHNLPEHGWVWVRTHTRPGAVELVVENTGKPLPAPQLVTPTEPFQRGTERTKSEDHAGFGLGLSIAQRIAQAHEGSLHLTPRESGGVTVTVLLPRPHLAQP